MSTDLDVAVVGAGIAGLTAAHALRKAGRTVRVFEATDQVGGRMATVRRDGFSIDAGAEQLPTHGYEATWELIRELGIPREDVPLIGAGIGMWREGRPHAGVAHPLGVLTGAGLSPRARLDLARFTASTYRRRREFDPDRPERTPLGDLTVAELARRYHPDLGAYLFQPVVSAFFGWDPRWSAAAPFVSLLQAVGPATTWRTYRDGMDTLARALAARTDVVTGTPVRQVVAGPDTASVVTDAGVRTARTVVLCVPAPVARALHANPADEERPYLDACTFTPMLKVSCLLDRPLTPVAKSRLYALLVPGVVDKVVAGAIIDHVKGPGRAPAGRGLITLLTAPAAIPELLDAPDDVVAARVTEAAEAYLPGLAEATTGTVVHRFRDGLPEVTPAALRLRPGFLRRPTRSVEFAGDWVLARPSSEGAVRAALIAADRVLARASTADRKERA